MSLYKKLIPSFGLKDGQVLLTGGDSPAKARDRRSEEYHSSDYLTLSRYYCDNGADALLIHDWSEQEADHERVIGMIKEIVRNVDIPVITGGQVKRLEDIKKYLYTGAEAVYLDTRLEEQIDLIKDGSDRFGNEKIYTYISDAAKLGRIEEFVQLGASVMILKLPREMLPELVLPDTGALVFCDECHINALTDCLKITNAEGVILTVPETAEGNWMPWKQELKARGIPVATLESSLDWPQLKQNADGLIPAVVQDYKTGDVLMLAYMNREAYETTLRTGKMTYYSRSRESLWCKGETSGHFQYVKALDIDCDRDTILAKVKQIGAACHTGSRSCFYTNLATKEYKETNPLKVFDEVFQVILERKESPREGSYTNYLFDKGIDKILKKLGEEATEIVIAAKNPNPEEIKYEIADFLYHMMVLMAEKGITWEDITEELSNR